jgi:hypothetical protein
LTSLWYFEGTSQREPAHSLWRADAIDDTLYQDHIVIDPEILVGKPVIKNLTEEDGEDEVGQLTMVPDC